MKKISTIVCAVVLVVSMLAFSACNFMIGGESTWEYESSDKEGTVELVSQFFEKTFANTNQVVTVKSKGEPFFTETIDGTSDHVVYDGASTETYSFINEEGYIYAMAFASSSEEDSDTSKSYWVSKDYYDSGYFAYKFYVTVFELLPEEGITFNCKVSGKGTIGENDEQSDSTSTLTLEVKNGDVGSITITATSKNDLVESVSYSQTAIDDNGETVNSNLLLTFEYGSASVTVPDLSDWYKNPNYDEIDE